MTNAVSIQSPVKYCDFDFVPVLKLRSSMIHVRKIREIICFIAFAYHLIELIAKRCFSA